MPTRSKREKKPAVNCLAESGISPPSFTCCPSAVKSTLTALYTVVEHIAAVRHSALRGATTYPPCDGGCNPEPERVLALDINALMRVFCSEPRAQAPSAKARYKSALSLLPSPEGKKNQNPLGAQSVIENLNFKKKQV